MASHLLQTRIYYFSDSEFEMVDPFEVLSFNLQPYNINCGGFGS